MSLTLYKIVNWTKENGESTTLSRINMRFLAQIREEGINLHEVEETTKCSEQLLASIKNAAEEIVGKTID
jgi:hypothetical protein